ncbi:Primosomal protein N' (replication factor Y) - superfamily II helicase-like [Hydrogenobaculum sp. Y04AAS1]|uniref:primosomal protein N' n=1 Tax=Hydrogenobaculum sp. (strain Y04AAS1) TaxID=380749 RepID=UPI00017BBE30|nr:Primosomal protein N' (replication factor Y) - superfamily II helicase-like [Hydrogenobaculum sp. Y04AAS1]HCT67089.1 primosomal protein N' [Hydrogenobaculum sp.]
MILKLATESRVLQEVYIDDEDVPPAGTRIFYTGLDGSIKGGILWGYDAKAVKSEKTVVYKDKLPIVNQSVFEAVKDAGEYYLYPAYTLLAKIIPDIMFKVNDKSLKLKKNDEDFTDKTFKRIFRLLKKRKLSLEEAYKKYTKNAVDFYIKKGFLEVENNIGPLVKIEDIDIKPSNEGRFSKRLNIEIITGDYKQKIKDITIGPFQSLVVVPSKYMFDNFRDIFEDAIFLKSPNTVSETRFCYESAMKEDRVFVSTPFGLVLPFYNLKNIILIDDMYSEFYKSKKEPYLDFRRLSYYVAKHYGANLYLVSLTLSINDYFLYKEKKANHIHISVKLPHIKIVEKKDKNFLIDDETIDIIKQHIDKNILFYVNKSGYSYAYCERCNALDTCVYCESYTTYFKSLNTIKCTKCKNVNQEGVCSRCGGPLKTFGAGLEQYKEYIISMFGDRENFSFDTIEKEDTYDVVFAFSLENLLFAPELSAREIYHHKLWSLSLKAKELFVLETTHVDKYALESILKNDQFIFLEDELKRRKFNNDPPFTKAILIEIGKEIYDLYKELSEEDFFYVSKPRYFYEKGEKRFKLLIKVKNTANIKRLGHLLKSYKNYKIHVGIESFL